MAKVKFAKGDRIEVITGEFLGATGVVRSRSYGFDYQARKHYQTLQCDLTVGHTIDSDVIRTVSVRVSQVKHQED